MTEPFDGDAIARADSEFLDSLSDHPLARRPLYGAPCPPQPDFGRLQPRPDENQATARQAVFVTVVDWMLVNYAYREGAFMSKGGASLLSTARSSPSWICADAWRRGR